MGWTHRARISVLAVILAAAPLALSATPAAAHVATTQHTAIPAYWGPDTEAGAAKFARLAQNLPTNDIVVINGSQSKPEIPVNGAWTNAIKKVHDAGALAIVYVDTGYYGFTFPPATPHATRPDGPGAGSTSAAAWTAQIKKDIDDWHTLYGAAGVDGIFLDQTVSLCGTTAQPNLYRDLYQTISDYISTNYPEDYIIINPGVPVPQCYENVADTIITFENTYAVYTDPNNPFSQVPAWQQNSANPNKFWHLVYDVPNQAAMQNVVALSRQRNVGYIYVTDDIITTDANGNFTGFPWDTIPPYWDNQLLTAANVTDTTKPAVPTGFTTTSWSGTSASKVALSWAVSSDNVAVADYEVFRNNVSIGSTYDNGLTVSGLAPSTTYTFRVRARDVAGNLSNLSGTVTVTTPAPSASPIVSPTACLSPTTARYQARYVDPFTYRRVFINTDNNTATGYILGGANPSGVDYMIENNFLYRYTGPGWNWTQVTGVSPLVSTTDDTYVWQVPKSAFTNAATTQVLVFQAASPDAYSSTVTVNQTASC